MTFDEIWNQLLRKRPELGDGGATIELTADNLRQLLRQVYEQGQKSADRDSKNPFAELFGRGFDDG